MGEKLAWHGLVTSVQPRIRLQRSFDERHHNYLGYALRIEGEIAGEQRVFWLGIGKSAQAKHLFQADDTATGLCEAVENPRLEVVGFYKASKLSVESRRNEASAEAPPWLGVPPDLDVYRARGHRRLNAATYERDCQSCIWGANMPVEMTIDQWNPSAKRYRVESFCYGPKNCRFYSPGPVRKVPGRKGMSYTEEDWVDEESAEHRGPEE